MDINDLVGKFDFAPSKWGKKEIEDWLDLINMGEYKATFEANKIDGLIIFDIDDDEMITLLSIKNSIHRKRLRKAILILSQYQKELGGNPKDAVAKSVLSESGLDMTGFNQSNLKMNSAWLQRANLATAQRSQGENIFQKNALRNLDSDPIIEETIIRLTESEKNLMEEEKFESLLSKSPYRDSLYGSIRNNSEKKQNYRSSPQREMLIEKPLNFNHISDNALDIKEEDGVSIMRSETNNQSANDWEMGTPENKAQKLEAQKPNESEQKEIGSVELIIQPVDGVQTNNFYCLNETGGRIGRHSNNEIVILEESVSRHHSKIEFQNGRFYLIDIGSTTGTFIKIQGSLQLREGMMLELGSNQFLVQEINCINETEGSLKLKIIEGMHMNQEFYIRNSATIGRKASYPNSIPFTDDFHLSNNHAKIQIIERKFVFEDLGSTNGSWLRLSPESQKSELYELAENTIFKIGASSTYKVKRSHTSYLDPANKQYDSSVNCAVCYENDRDVVFMPCKHNVVCLRCSKNVKMCPVCRIKITDVIRIYNPNIF